MLWQGQKRELDSIFACPFAGCGLVSGTVCFVDVGDLRDERIIRIGVCEHGANGQQDFGDCECWTPLVSQYIKADASVGVDVRMVNAGGEVDLWGLERIIGGEMDC